jgi:hypothetical protein
MKEQFRNKIGLNKSNIFRLIKINEIIQEYAEEGYRLTLRQLYYQLVSRGIIENNQKEYAKLSNLLVKGRMAGEVDWNIIEDRIRVPYIPYFVHGIQDAIKDTIEQYRLDRMKDQPSYIEIWVEKDALSGVLKPITQKYHVNLMVNRGYSSCSAMYDASKRFLQNDDKQGFILYLGDHDPSGLDMIRDIQTRLNEFGVSVSVEPLALTTEQVKKYNPVPNPAKFKDPRASDYISNFGKISWEVDALNPKILSNLISNRIEQLIDIKRFNKQIKQEEVDKNKLIKFTKTFDK